ncbi:MAG: AMP-binding protein [Prolixibacteraceae bacterium]|nr:AMP-binding protein [Prolixibacteraceae bacterium]
MVSFTSGTRGEPKMVMLDQVYPLAHIITAKYWHNLHEDSIHLTIADTGWLKAVWGKLYGQWIVGATMFVYDHEKFIPSDILEILSKYKVTSLCAPPTIFRFLIREELSRYDLSSLEWCTIAGEALNPKVYNQFFKLTGIRLREGYGQSESTLLVLTTPWVEPKPGSMGLPGPHYEIDLLTPDDPSGSGGVCGHRSS